jgi:hypothetical protein
MKAKIYLRTAAIIMLIHGVGHTFGTSGWKESTDPKQKHVISAMTGPKFPFMGTMRSMGNFFDGYLYYCSVALLLVVLVLWWLSTEVSSESPLLGKITLSVAICLILFGIDELIFFFPAAAAMSLISAALTLIAWFLVKRNRRLKVMI